VVCFTSVGSLPTLYPCWNKNRFNDTIRKPLVKELFSKFQSYSWSQSSWSQWKKWWWWSNTPMLSYSCDLEFYAYLHATPTTYNIGNQEDMMKERYEIDGADFNVKNFVTEAVASWSGKYKEVEEE
ncbi:hypothetical protein NECAME_08842, partial [Necator americanus]